MENLSLMTNRLTFLFLLSLKLSAADFTIQNVGSVATPAVGGGGDALMSCSYMVTRQLWNGFGYVTDYPTVGGVMNGVGLPSIPPYGSVIISWSANDLPFLNYETFNLIPLDSLGIHVLATFPSGAQVYCVNGGGGGGNGGTNIIIIPTNAPVKYRHLVQIYGQIKQPDGSYVRKLVALKPAYSK